MNNTGDKYVLVDGRPMAILVELYRNVVEVHCLPACSIGTHLMILSELRDMGYEVI